MEFKRKEASKGENRAVKSTEKITIEWEPMLQSHTDSWFWWGDDSMKRWSISSIIHQRQQIQQSKAYTVDITSTWDQIAYRNYRPNEQTRD